ncbi:unnamed protein product [Prunus armeniaca]
MSDLRAMISKLKSSHAEKDSELSSSAADSLLARLRTYHKSNEKSKFEAIIDAYKLGNLHCTNGTTPFYVIEDGDIETFCLDLFPVQSEYLAPFRKPIVNWIPSIANSWGTLRFSKDATYG